MPALIFGLVGRPGSGKGTVASYLVEHQHAVVFRFSAFLNDVLDLLAIPRSRDNQIKLSTCLRNTFGEDALSYAVVRAATTCKNPIVVVDGIRRIEDIAALESLPNFTLIDVTAPDTIRFERMKARGEKAGENNMTWETFNAQEQAPTEITIPQVAERATVHLDNSGTPEELIAQLKTLLTKLGIE